MAYLEQVIIDNLIINTILILLTVKLLKAKITKWRIALSAIIGMIFAVFLPFVTSVLFLYKLFALFSTTLFIIKYPNIKRYIFATLVFACLSFALGGIVYGFFNFINTGRNGMMVYPSNGVIYLVFAAVVFMLYIFRQYTHYARRRRNLTSIDNTAELDICNVKYTVNCINDTGNQLFDDLTLKPVSVISNEIGLRSVTGKERTILVRTVAATKELPLITIDNLILHTESGDKNLGKQLAVVSDEVFDKYKLIINIGSFET
ncbi:MAG: sigma-E processing peptidase SpoIIGA [Clostridia bacterium]